MFGHIQFLKLVEMRKKYRGNLLTALDAPQNLGQLRSKIEAQASPKKSHSANKKPRGLPLGLICLCKNFAQKFFKLKSAR